MATPEKIGQAMSLCERILSSNPSERVQYTTRAALCYIYLKIDDKKKSGRRGADIASSLPSITSL